MSEIRIDNNSIIIVNRDITSLDVECIVNAANRTLLGGGGVDGAIHRAAGPGLLEECKTLNGCNVGEAKITRGYNLKARFVIHTVGPIYSASPEDPKKLSCCYRNSLELAKENSIHSIAFPSISAGVYGYPMKDAASVALKTVTQWLRDNPQYGIDVTMCCFHDSTVKIYEDICKKLIYK